MSDDGIRCHDLGKPMILVHNASDKSLQFAHTKYCEPNPESCVSRVSDEWLEGPPKAGDTIAAGQYFKVGQLDTTYWFHEHLIFLTFPQRPDVKIAISVGTTDSGTVLVSVHGFTDNESSGSQFHHSRCDLLSITQSPPTINVEVPGPAYWLSLKGRDERYDGSAGNSEENIAIVSQMMSVALGTLITACFVVPGWGTAAVGLTFLEGSLHFILSPTASQQRAVVTQMKALLTANAKLFQQQHFDQLQMHMEKISNSFAEENLGLNKSFTEICEHLNSQKSGISFDDNLKQTISMCLDDLTQIVADGGGFQTSLQECLGVVSKASDAYENPIKSRLAIIFAATSMTMNAYAIGTTLCQFIKAEISGWRPNPTALMASIELFSPQRVLKWMFATKQRIEGFDIKENAKANRFGYVRVEITAMGYNFGPEGLTELKVQDPALELHNWGPGSDSTISALLQNMGFRDARGLWIKIPTWTLVAKVPSFRLENKPPQYDISKKVGDMYKKYLDDLIETEYHELVERPLAELEESGTPYVALLPVPLSPIQGNEITKVMINRRQTIESPVELPFRFVQYGYSFANSSEAESQVLWQSAMLPIEPRRGEVDKGIFIYPKGADLSVPVDPWNTKAKAFAARAQLIANLVEPGHRTILPPFSSSRRIVYRRFCTTEAKQEWTDSNSKVESIHSLDNASPNEFFDDWTQSIKALSQIAKVQPTS